MKCLIVTAGEQPEYELLAAYTKDADLVICADGAADTLMAHSIIPDVLIGDFDSADSASIAFMEASGAALMRLEVDKNETDTEAAVALALESGAEEIVVLGALGRRLDHALGNLGMLLKADRAQVPCRIIDALHEITAAHGDFELHGNPGQTVSILPLGGDIIVTATNLKYPLEKLLLRCDASRGISNILLDSPAALHIEGGTALIIKISGNASHFPQ